MIVEVQGQEKQHSQEEGKAYQEPRVDFLTVLTEKRQRRQRRSFDDACKDGDDSQGADGLCLHGACPRMFAYLSPVLSLMKR